MAVNAAALKGFRDLLPGEMLARERIISTIRRIYERYGFVPLSTPALEHRDVLLGYGEEASKQIYLFTDPDGADVGLRFDLTAPLSRVVAEHRDLPRPFKRYQVQPVWRYDKPDPGRFREFLQFDIDTVGATSRAADAEIVAAMHDCLEALGLAFRIRYSSRNVMNALVALLGLDAGMVKPVLRIIDKLDKQGIENVKLELGPGRTDESGAVIEGLGLGDERIATIERFLAIRGETRAATIDEVRAMLGDAEGADTGVADLADIDRFLTAMGIADERVVVDPSIARGLDYYTGPVFEAVLTDAKLERFGSVMGGGRYDGLIEVFTGERTPATGASIGVDRLFSAMQTAGLIEMKPSTADVIVTVMDRKEIVRYGTIAVELRRAGFNTELYLGNQKSIGKQLKYADRQMIPVAVIAGSNEFERGEVSIKDLRVIKETTVEIEERSEWVEKKVGQVTVKQTKMVAEIRRMLSARTERRED
ncbi:MAG: histidine--tRNA ligase [Candidatus Krumholzibacteriota bacterium]|nr:histidine--tRNA ligase [Candidatus Krumholzibacteriota bacterium]